MAARSSGCSCTVTCLAVLFAIFLALDVIFFGGMIGLAWYGIEEADNENSCRTANSTQDCVLLIELVPPISGILRRGQIPDFNYDLYQYWMAGATVCGVVWAFINALTLIALSELIRTHLGVLAKLERKVEDESHELKALPAGASASTDSASPTPKPKTKPGIEEFKGPDGTVCFTDHIGGVPNQEWPNKPLRHFGSLSTLSLFISSVSCACAILCLVWGIAISFNHARQDRKTVVSFIIVEILVAVGMPVFLCTSVAFLAVVLEYVTMGKVDLRMLIPRLIYMVKFESGEKFDYWVVDDIFYYRLKKKEGRSDKGCWFAVDKSPATCFLAIIIGTTINLVISYFVNLTLDAQITVSSCDDPLIDRSYDCFNASTLIYVDCVDQTGTRLLHCFKFYRFGVETNIITGITTSYAFYLFAVAALRQIFSVVRNLINIKPSRYWGVGFVAVSLIFFVASIITTVIWIQGYAIDTIPEIRRINIIHLWQFFLVSVFVLMVGCLLLSTWYERLHTVVHAKVVEVPLVHYNDTQRKHLHKLEIADTWPPPDSNDVNSTHT